MCGVALRVLVPYYQQKQDQPMLDASRHEATAFMEAVYQFSEQNPEKRFPTNLNEVASIVLANGNKQIAATNLAAVYNKYVYLQPTPHKRDDVMMDKAILVEKLGHYKNRKGGFIGTVGGITQWYPLKAYKELIEKNGLSIEKVTDYEGRNRMVTNSRNAPVARTSGFGFSWNGLRLESSEGLPFLDTQSSKKHCAVTD